MLEAFCTLPWVVEVAARGDTKATVVGQDGLRFDLRVVPPECYGNLLQHFTGSKDHNVALREAAVRRGLSVSEYGITVVETGEVHAFETEKEVYAYLGYEWIPPELREGGGELEAARAGTLPDLVELGDLRGDLHTHTTWSDGKDTLEAMVAEAMRRGYSYYAICDHSHRLRDGRLEQQTEAIEELGRHAADPAPEGDRGEHPRRRHARRGRRRPGDARLGRRFGPQLLRPQPDRARPRGDGEPVRRLHRPPHEPQDRPARAVRRSTSSA